LRIVVRLFMVVVLLAAALIVTASPAAAACPPICPEPPDYILDISPLSNTAMQGGSATYTITITRSFYTGPIFLSMTSSQAGLAGTFSSTTANSSTLTVSVAPNQPAGTYIFTVRGNTPLPMPGPRSLDGTLTVTPVPADFVVAVQQPTGRNVTLGTTVTYAIDVIRNANCTCDVALTVTSQPAGVTGTFSPNPNTGPTSTLRTSTLTIDTSYLPPNSYLLTIVGTWGSVTRSATASIVVTAAGGAVFPAMTNGAYGGYVTAATIKNIGSAPTTVRIVYFNQSGMSVGAGDVINNLPVNAGWTVRQDNGNSFPSNGGNAVQAGSAVVYSSEPIASFVNEFPPGNVGDATSYTGVPVPSGVGTTLYAPTIVNNAYGGYTTGIGLLNQGSSPTDVTITYRAGDGTVVKTQTITALAAHAYQALYSGDPVLALPAAFAGTATITSSAGQPLGAIVNETGPGGQFSSYDAVPTGSTLLNVPVALNNAYGGYFTGMGIQNTSASVGIVSVTYYDASGTATAKSFSIAANGSLGVYQGSATDGPPAGAAYTAVIQSSTVSLAAIVNEVAPAGAGAARQSTSYNTFSAGSASLNLPLVENAGSDPWNTGEGIMNTGSASTAVQVSYYDSSTGAAIGTAQTLVLAPHAFWGLYQPTGGLPAGTRATAVITTASGGQVAVICNESSSTTFMSYDGQ
jgi:hypothetical protein